MGSPPFCTKPTGLTWVAGWGTGPLIKSPPARVSMSSGRVNAGGAGYTAGTWGAVPKPPMYVEGVVIRCDHGLCVNVGRDNRGIAAKWYFSNGASTVKVKVWDVDNGVVFVASLRRRADGVVFVTIPKPLSLTYRHGRAVRFVVHGPLEEGEGGATGVQEAP